MTQVDQKAVCCIAVPPIVFKIRALLPPGVGLATTHSSMAGPVSTPIASSSAEIANAALTISASGSPCIMHSMNTRRASYAWTAAMSHCSYHSLEPLLPVPARLPASFVCLTFASLACAVGRNRVRHSVLSDRLDARASGEEWQRGKTCLWRTASVMQARWRDQQNNVPVGL